MKYLLLLALWLGLSTSAVTQGLPFFINTNQAGVSPRIAVDFTATAAYGSQFAVAYDITNPQTTTDRPVIYLYNDDGTIASTTVMEEGSGANLSRGASSPDGTRAWFAGEVAVMNESGNSRDIALVRGDDAGFSYGKMSIGRNDVLRGFTAANDGACALIDARDGASYSDSLTVAWINNDLSSGATAKFFLPLGAVLENFQFNAVGNAALVIYRVEFESTIVRVDLDSGVSEEITFLPSTVICSTGGEELNTRAVLSSVYSDRFYLLTSCLNFVVISEEGVSVITPENAIDEISFQLIDAVLIVDEETPNSLHAFVLVGSGYQLIDLTTDLPIILESGAYGNGISLGRRNNVTRTVNGKHLLIDDEDAGKFNIITEAAPESWSEVAANPLNLPQALISESRGWKIAKVGGHIIGTNEVNNLPFDRANIQFFSENGSVQETLEMDNQGISEAILLDNGNYAVSIRVNNPAVNGSFLKLIEFSQSDGIIGEIASREVGIGFTGSFWQQLSAAPNGDLVVAYTYYNASFFRQYWVSRYAQDGTEIFSVAFSSTSQFKLSFAPLGMDLSGNSYLLFRSTESTTGLTLISLDASGTTRFVSTVASSLSFTDQHQIITDPAGNMKVIGVGRDAENVYQAVIIDVDTTSGQAITETLLSPNLYSYSLDGNYIPGADTLVLYHSYFAGVTADVVEERRERILFLDNDLEVFYEQELSATQLAATEIADVFVSEDRNLYAIGSRFIPELNTSVTTLIGVDFSNLTQVVSVADEFAITANLRLFPNPTTDRISLNWNSTAAGHYQVEILDQLGRRLSRQSGDHPSGPVSVNVGLAHLPIGIYYTRLITGEGQSTQPIMRK